MENTSKGRLHGLLVTASCVTGLSYFLLLNKSIFNWVTNFLGWCPTSMDLLKNAETKMLSCLKKPYEVSFIPVTHEGEDCVVRSLVIRNSDENEIPLVLLHGFASGIGLWILNLEELSEGRPIYALDILGFGLSSRPSFSKDAELAENQLVESIEQWRKQVGLEEFVLLGHSMGGFLATSYAIKYPKSVKHLILADPWGFPSRDLAVKKIEVPFWAKAIATMLRPFNPLAVLRVAGPWGPRLVSRLRPDILHKFESMAETQDVADYIYHSNAQKPSGEEAFKAMTAQFGWAKRPMIERVTELRQDIPITFIYGSRSWVDSNSGNQTSSLRKNSFVDVKLITGAGHHVYADRIDVFNKMVTEVCKEYAKKDLNEKYTTEAIPKVCI